MIVSVLVRRLKEGRTYEEFVAEWAASASAPEAVRHERIDSVIESTELRCMYEVHSEHDFTALPRLIAAGSEEPAGAPRVTCAVRAVLGHRDAGAGIRTRMPVRAGDFKSPAYTVSPLRPSPVSGGVAHQRPNVAVPGVRSTAARRADSTARAHSSGRMGQRRRMSAWRMWRMFSPRARIVRRPSMTSLPVDEGSGAPFCAVLIRRSLREDRHDLNDRRRSLRATEGGAPYEPGSAPATAVAISRTRGRVTAITTTARRGLPSTTARW